MKKRGRPSVRRKDPPTVSPDGVRPWGRLVNPDPAMHYVYANPNDEEMGVGYYEDLGYEMVLRTEGGVKSAVRGVNRGDHVTTLHGMILMQIPKGDFEDPQPGTRAHLVANGQATADETERKIIAKGARGMDKFRGFHGLSHVHGVTMLNETEAGREVTFHG